MLCTALLHVGFCNANLKMRTRLAPEEGGDSVASGRRSPTLAESRGAGRGARCCRSRIGPPWGGSQPLWPGVPQWSYLTPLGEKVHAEQEMLLLS